MNWESIGVGVSVASILLGANAGLMKLVIGSEINKCLLSISDKYVTKDDFEKHIDHCPYANSVKRDGQ